MLLLLLAAAALPLQAAAQLYIPTDLGCDAEDELLGNLRWLRSVCAEVGAAFADDATPVPTTIADLGCARAARRAADRPARRSRVCGFTRRGPHDDYRRGRNPQPRGIRRRFAGAL